MSDPLDSMVPWTIRAVPTATRDAITKAARLDDATVGQWLEKRVAEWLADGSPTTLQTPSDMPARPADTAATVAATAAYISACAAARTAGLKVDEQALGRMQKGAEAAVRAAQGLPPLAVRLAPGRAPAMLPPPDRPGNLAPPAEPGKPRG